MEINELLQNITDTCREKMSTGVWGKNEVMRYAYVTLGKKLSKSAKFFFSIEGKYGEHGLSVEEMKKIHYANSGYEVTCYVSAKMLKDIFSKLGIESTIIQSNIPRPYYSDDGVLDIYHSYLLCTGDENKKYFLSLNSDLVNIKLGAAPEHFGVDVPYYYNGHQSYQGDEIDNAVFSPKELLEIDKKIGYTYLIHNMATGKDVHVYANLNDTKHDVFGNQKLPYDYLMFQLPLLDKGFTNDYEQLFNSFKNKNGESKTRFTELTLQELRRLEWYVFTRCLELVKQNLELENIDENHFYEIFNNRNLDIENLKKEASKFIQETLKTKETPISSTIQTNSFRTLSLAIKLISVMEKLSDPKLANADEKERVSYRRLYTESKDKVALLFLDKETFDMYTGDKNPTNEFLVEKILTSMEEDFECSISRKCSYRPIFSTDMQAVEQAKFIKDYLRTLLKLELPTEADFQQRIMFSSLAELGNPDKIAFMIYVKSKDNDPNIQSYSMVYNPETNTIDPASIPRIRFNYKILSKTVNAQINGSSKSLKQSQPNDE